MFFLHYKRCFHKKKPISLNKHGLPTKFHAGGIYTSNMVTGRKPPIKKNSGQKLHDNYPPITNAPHNKPPANKLTDNKPPGTNAPHAKMPPRVKKNPASKKSLMVCRPLPPSILKKNCYDFLVQIVEKRSETNEK